MGNKTLYGFLWDQLKFSTPNLVQACEEIVNTVGLTGGILSKPKIWAYLTKKNGDQFWQDDSQSALVNAFYLSDTFQEIDPIQQSQNLPEDERVVCHYKYSIDNSVWGLNTYEWRFGAEKYRLIFSGPDKKIISPNYTGSLVLPGSPPELTEVTEKGPSAPRMNVKDWKDFLLT